MCIDAHLYTISVTDKNSRILVYNYSCYVKTKVTFISHKSRQKFENHICKNFLIIWFFFIWGKGVGKYKTSLVKSYFPSSMFFGHSSSHSLLEHFLVSFPYSFKDVTHWWGKLNSDVLETACLNNFS